MKKDSMEITLGPVLFDWSRKTLLDFYEEAAKMAVDSVHIGEVVCSKRAGLSIADIDKTAKMLTDAGKKVYLSNPYHCSERGGARAYKKARGLALPGRGQRHVGHSHL